VLFLPISEHGALYILFMKDKTSVEDTRFLEADLANAESGAGEDVHVCLLILNAL